MNAGDLWTTRTGHSRYSGDRPAASSRSNAFLARARVRPRILMAEQPSRLLVVDDDASILAVVERFASPLGFEVVFRSNGEDALACLASVKPDAALVDLQMPGIGGIDVLRAVRAADPDCQVILMTGNATLDTAIEAVKAGALDYLTKPFDFERLRGLLVTVREGIRRRERLLEVDADVARQFEFHGMIGRSPAMQELFDSIRRLAPHARTVLVSGETGTGKELVARAMHKLGPRHARTLITVNCSAVVENLFESELFGHTRGAFTGATEAKVGLFEHADGGTLFLDEAGELPLSLQPKLLRAVEYGEVQRVGSLETRKADVNVIAATNRDLRAEAAAGRFRSDLFYRLSILEIHLVPLRERREDIPYLTAMFVHEFAEAFEAADHRGDAGRRATAAARLVAGQHPRAQKRHRAGVHSDGKPHSERTRAAEGHVDIAAGQWPRPAHRRPHPYRSAVGSRTCSRRRSANKSSECWSRSAGTKRPPPGCSE